MKGGRDDELGLLTYCHTPIHPGGWHDVLTIDESIASGQDIRWHKTQFAFRMYATDHKPQAALVCFNDHDFINRDPKYAVPVDVPELGNWITGESKILHPQGRGGQ
jgi:hypothetical protein